jgi:type IV secretion system protein VirB4
VEAAIEQRRKFFEAGRDNLYQAEIFYCILLEGARSKTGVGTALARLLRDPEGAIGELKSQFTNDSMKKLLRTHIERDLQRLDQLFNLWKASADGAQCSHLGPAHSSCPRKSVRHRL